MSGQTTSPLCFVDAQGGALARLGAAIAHALGQTDAIATTLGDVLSLPEDVTTVLGEVGMTAPETSTFNDGLTSKHLVVWLGEGSSRIANAQAWPAALLAPDAPQFDRLVVARVVRDRLERQIKATRH